jgi:Xaa-Pro aminopeptidase
MAWESNQAMAAVLRPGITAADVYAAGAAVEGRFGLWERVTGRTGHGYRNTGGLSVFPGCQTVLDAGMVISVEPIYHTPYGQFDLEDQYLITETGAECLHEPAPEHLPIVED